MTCAHVLSLILQEYNRVFITICVCMLLFEDAKVIQTCKLVAIGHCATLCVFYNHDILQDTCIYRYIHPAVSEELSNKTVTLHVDCYARCYN